MNKSLRHLRMAGYLAYSHKKKLILSLVLVYLGKKGYDLYKSVKPLLDAMGGIKTVLAGNQPGAQQAAAQGEEVSPSVQQLMLIVQGSPIVKTQIKLFQSSFKNIKQTLSQQPQFISGTIRGYFRLKEIKGSTAEKGISSEERHSRWRQLTFCVFSEAVAQVFCQRIVNVLTVLQLGITSKVYYKTKVLKAQNEDEKVEQQEGVEGQGEQQLRENEEVLRQVGEYLQACEEFMSQTYSQMVTKLIIEYVCPQVKQEVEEQLGEIPLTAKISLDQMSEILSKIYDRLEEKFFSQKKVVRVLDDFDDGQNDDQFLPSAENDFDDDYEDRFASCLVHQVVSIYEGMASGWDSAKQGKLREIGEEFVDYLLVEQYVDSMMVDTIYESYERDLKQFVLGLMQMDEMFQDKDIVAIPKITTYMFKICTQGLITQKLKDCPFLDKNNNFLSLLKNVYFQKDEFEQIENKALIQFNPEQSQDFLGGLGDLTSLLGGLEGGGDLQSLLGALSGMNSGPQ